MMQLTLIWNAAITGIQFLIKLLGIVAKVAVFAHDELQKILEDLKAAQAEEEETAATSTTTGGAGTSGQHE